MPQLPTHTMSVGDVATAIQRSVARVLQLDERLMPVRNRAGHRRYSPQVIAEYVAARESSK